ncbi:hypothetical protein [Streptomyces sp. NPDC051677]|uniref:hypothetical protein n=1 Tax=Streptomyces sp. NPDC051677 TaxID=3365669 RepID=UPI0037CF1654
MRSPTWVGGRRGAVWGASAVAVVVVGAAGLLAGCGGDGRGGDYVAIGAAGGPAAPGTGAGGSAGPTGGVRLVPLDGGSNSATAQPGPGAKAQAQGPLAAAPGGPEPGSPQGASPTRGGASTSGASSAEGGSGGRTTPGSTSPSASPSPAPSGSGSAGPAVLVVSDTVRAGTDQRWCEDVTLTLHNSGGTAVRSGAVAFGTHVIDALGIDWATRESTAPLPTPIAAGARGEDLDGLCRQIL